MGDGPAPDINETAWDPNRDSSHERRSFLQELDPILGEDAGVTFVPERRTRAGQPLGERGRALLLGSTFEDLEAIANQVNLAARVDDFEEAQELGEAISAYEDLLGAYRRLPRHSDERTMTQMPVTVRREARQLQNRIRQLQAERYEGVRLRRRRAEAAVQHLEALLKEARTSADPTQIAEYERLLALHRQELEQLRALDD